MSKPFVANVKVCPHCHSTDFVRFDRTRNLGWHPLSRFYCRFCKSPFWRPKSETQLTTGQQGQSWKHFESHKHKHKH